VVTRWRTCLWDGNGGFNGFRWAGSLQPLANACSTLFKFRFFFLLGETKIKTMLKNKYDF